MGDKVRVLGDVTKVSELQKGHGGWGQHTALVGSLDGRADGSVYVDVSLVTIIALLVLQKKVGMFSSDFFYISPNSRIYNHLTSECLQLHNSYSLCF